jgi:phosphopantetheinyl transferase
LALFYQHNINATTKLAIWKIEEEESFFTASVQVQREITHPHKRLQHLAGRYLLRFLFPDFPFEEILIADTRKPYLPYEQYHFSISHCGDYAAAIVSSTERVGIDIEIPTARVLKIAHKFLHADELVVYKNGEARMEKREWRSENKEARSEEQDVQTRSTNSFLQSPDPILLTLLWSCKEAMFKWWGWGEVDFSEMLRIDPFELKEEGKIDANFVHPSMNASLQLQYKMMPNLCLAWLSTNDVKN